MNVGESLLTVFFLKAQEELLADKGKGKRNILQSVIGSTECSTVGWMRTNSSAINLYTCLKDDV